MNARPCPHGSARILGKLKFLLFAFSLALGSTGSATDESTGVRIETITAETAPAIVAEPAPAAISAAPTSELKESRPVLHLTGDETDKITKASQATEQMDEISTEEVDTTRIKALGELIVAQIIRLELKKQAFLLQISPEYALEIQRDTLNNIHLIIDGLGTAVGRVISSQIAQMESPRLAALHLQVKSLNAQIDELMTSRLDSEKKVSNALFKYRKILDRENNLIARGKKFKSKLPEALKEVEQAEAEQAQAKALFNQNLQSTNNTTPTSLPSISTAHERANVLPNEGSEANSTKRLNASETESSQAASEAIALENAEEKVQQDKLNAFRRKMGLDVQAVEPTPTVIPAEVQTVPVLSQGKDGLVSISTNNHFDQFESFSAPPASQSLPERLADASKRYEKRKKGLSERVFRAGRFAIVRLLNIAVPTVFLVDALTQFADLNSLHLTQEEINTLLPIIDEHIAELDGIVKFPELKIKMR